MAYTRLRYHIVTATRQREPLITGEVERLIYAALHAKAAEHGAKLLAVEAVSDHIHIVAAIPPRIAVSTFVREIKTASSRAVNQQKIMEGEFHWQEGYGAFTLNPHDLAPVLHYVANQKRHHAEGDLWTPYERTSE
jgi:putative transposase